MTEDPCCLNVTSVSSLDEAQPSVRKPGNTEILKIDTRQRAGANFARSSVLFGLLKTPKNPSGFRKAPLPYS